MAFDASGDIYIAGASWIPEQGAFDLLLLKYDTDGNLLWDRTLDDGDGYTDSGYALAIDPDGNAIVAGFTNPDPYLVKYSPTGDLLWEEVHGGQSTNDYWRYVETDAEGNIYVFGQIAPGGGAANHLWTTKYDPDGNILWEQTYIGTYPNACYVGGLALMPDGGVVITGQSWDLPFHTNIVTIRYASDGTVLWQRNETAGYLHASGKDVAVDADGSIYVTGYGFGYSSEEDIITLGYSPDGDVLWTQIYIGPDYEGQSDYPHEIAVDEATNVFVAAHSWGDNGNDFTTIMYMQGITAVGLVETPEDFALYQNYPNPFNPATKINYSVAEVGFVTLKVYDVLGNEVASLVNEEKTAGSYEINFDGSELTSGIYFYKLKAGNYVETKKMILLK